jgi:adenylate cyclase
MGAAGDIRTNTDAILSTAWNRRTGQVVPKTDDVALKNGAVDLEAAVLYADLAKSTELAGTFQRTTAAKIVRAYLSAMTRLITYHGGEIRSFDGDRVMGVFVGGNKNTSAAKCALRMNWALTKVLRPKAEAKFPSLKKSGFVLEHCVGVHRSDLLVVRGGIRDNSDLVFIGTAPNLAAKLSDIRNAPYRSYITWHVYDKLGKSAKIDAKTGRSFW